MSRPYRSFLLANLLLFLIVPSAGQLDDPGWSFGAGGGVFRGQGDDVTNDVKYGGRAFVRYGFAPPFQLEVGGGMNEIGGPDFKTLLVPIDARLLINPVSTTGFSAYLFAGGGVIRYNVREGSGTRPSGWTPFLPTGVGIQFAVGEKIAIETSAGFNYSLIDSLDAGPSRLRGLRKDGFWNATLGISYVLGSGSADPDKDGLPNSLEKEIATDPRNPDTDGDGLSDGEEYRKYKTNPTRADTDGDGLADGEEIHTTRTDPVKADSDGDGLSDGDELKKYKTDPLRVDSDGDGLTDGDEVMKHGTDPLAADTDTDGVNDGDEVNRYRTNPLQRDTDLGTVDDGVEIARGSDPLNAADDVPKIEVKVGKRIVLEGVNFNTGSAELTPESAAKLEEVVAAMRESVHVEVEISGHTDNTGSRRRNVELSFERANSVKGYLVARGIAATRVRTKGYGPDRPVGNNRTSEGRAKNRRIEFTRLR